MARKPLNNRQMQCIELMVYSDMLKGEIAEKLSVRPETISAWLNREDFQEALKIEMQKGFSSMAIKARKRLDKLIDSNNEGIALAAAREALNKAGYQETQKIEQTFKDITIEIED